MPASCLLAVCSCMLLTQMWWMSVSLFYLFLDLPSPGSLRERHVVTSMHPKRNEAVTKRLCRVCDKILGPRLAGSPKTLQRCQRQQKLKHQAWPVSTSFISSFIFSQPCGWVWTLPVGSPAKKGLLGYTVWRHIRLFRATTLPLSAPLGVLSTPLQQTC